MSCIFGENRDVFFPKLSEAIHLIKFTDIAEKYLKELGYEPFICQSEDEARDRVIELKEKGQWPCYFTASDTTGEKEFEEFFTDNEKLDLVRFNNLGVIKNEAIFDNKELNYFSEKIISWNAEGIWRKEEIVELFKEILPELDYEDKGKYLDAKM